MEIKILILGIFIGGFVTLIAQILLKKRATDNSVEDSSQKIEIFVDTIKDFNAEDDNPEQEDIDIIDQRKRTRNFYS